jgi:hypothetical protein
MLAVILAAVALISLRTTAQTVAPVALPRIELRSATPLVLPGEVDSNSPAVWDFVRGERRLFVMTSVDGRPSTASGPTLTRLGKAVPIAMAPWPDGGVWMEAVIPDVDGTWYGYYHLERPATVCRDATRVIPSIGAARSRDFGATWESLGTLLAAPPFSHDCVTNDKYNVGGLGDFTVQLDPASRDLFFFFSQYVRSGPLQGVGVARLAWADRDQPARRVMVWQNSRWMTAAARFGPERFVASAIPIFPAAESWHDTNTIVDAFWGPSVHWNTHLRQYVMLLNRSKDTNWNQEGIYVSFARQLGDPREWSKPVKILNGGHWYPQVIGIEDGTGTDRTAGEMARLFVKGASTRLIRFIK